jgi:FkbM family methyltransferase
MANLSKDGPEAILEIMSKYNFNPKGIIHVGANVGWECLAYSKTAAKNIIYIEPIPELFKRLQENIKPYDGHFAIQAVCSDLDGQLIEFNVASNDGVSSSMLPLGAHASLHPNIKYTHKFKTHTKKLDTLMSERLIKSEDIDYLVLDVQGAELKVLKGATQLLDHIKFLIVEVSEFPLYEGGCTLDELTKFLQNQNFVLKQSYLLEGEGDALFIKI